MRGQFKLVHQGFGYTKMFSSVSTGITTWRCALNQSYPHLKCRAKCHTRQIGTLQKVKQIGDHTHPKTIAPRPPMKKSRPPTKKLQPQQNGKKKAKSKSKKEKPKKKVQVLTTVKPKAKVVELQN